MKKFILTFGLIAVLGLTATSCSTDDSAINDTQSDFVLRPGGGFQDNGDKDLPKLPQKP